MDYELKISDFVEKFLDGYFTHLDGEYPKNMYKMVIKEVEIPLIKAALSYVDNNKQRAAELLGISRGTLRKKIIEYGL